MRKHTTLFAAVTILLTSFSLITAVPAQSEDDGTWTLVYAPQPPSSRFYGGMALYLDQWMLTTWDELLVVTDVFSGQSFEIEAPFRHGLVNTHESTVWVGGEYEMDNPPIKDHYYSLWKSTGGCWTAFDLYVEEKPLVPNIRTMCPDPGGNLWMQAGIWFVKMTPDDTFLPLFCPSDFYRFVCRDIVFVPPDEMWFAFKYLSSSLPELFIQGIYAVGIDDGIIRRHFYSEDPLTRLDPVRMCADGDGRVWVLGLVGDVLGEPWLCMWSRDSTLNIDLSDLIEPFDDLPMDQLPGKAMTADSQGNIWIVVYHVLLKLDCRTLTWSRFEHPTTWWQPEEVLATEDGRLWFVDREGEVWAFDEPS